VIEKSMSLNPTPPTPNPHCAFLAGSTPLDECSIHIHSIAGAPKSGFALELTSGMVVWQALDTAVRGFITDCGQRIDDLKGMVRQP